MTPWLQAMLGTSIGGSVLAILGFVLYRSEKAAATANTAMTALGGAVRMTERMRKGMDLQQQRLDEWEDWGHAIRGAWSQMRAKMLAEFGVDIGELPTPPEGHLDLSHLFDDT